MLAAVAVVRGVGSSNNGDVGIPASASQREATASAIVALGYIPEYALRQAVAMISEEKSVDSSKSAVCVELLVVSRIRVISFLLLRLKP